MTQKELAFEFEVGEATFCDTIRRVEDSLIKDGIFSLPGKKVLLEDESVEAVLVLVPIRILVSSRNYDFIVIQ